MRKLLQKPWITKGLLTSIKKKRQMFKSHFLSGDVKCLNLMNARRMLVKYGM